MELKKTNLSYQELLKLYDMIQCAGEQQLNNIQEFVQTEIKKRSALRSQESLRNILNNNL